MSEKISISEHIFKTNEFLSKAINKTIELLPQMYEAGRIKRELAAKKQLQRANEEYPETHTEQGF